jgi:tetratricopeptide (TPR) repeat protein
MQLGSKFQVLVQAGVSSNPKGDLQRADELASKALALDPDWSPPHSMKALILRFQGRTEEAFPEDERALALDPSNMSAVVSLGFDYGDLGDFEKGLEYFDRAILLSPHDPFLAHSYGGKALANFALKRYDQAIEAARQAITANQTAGVQYIHATLIAALALAGHERTRARRSSATSRCPPPGRSRRSRRSRRTSPHRAAVRPASRRTSGSTTACAKPGCRRNERSRFGRRRPLCEAGSSPSGGEAYFALAMQRQL